MFIENPLTLLKFNLLLYRLVTTIFLLNHKKYIYFNDWNCTCTLNYQYLIQPSFFFIKNTSWQFLLQSDFRRFKIQCEILVKTIVVSLIHLSGSVLFEVRKNIWLLNSICIAEFDRKSNDVRTTKRACWIRISQFAIQYKKYKTIFNCLLLLKILTAIINK